MKRHLFGLAALLVLAGCGQPYGYYSQAHPEEIEKMTDGEMLFQLRSTNLTLGTATAANAKPDQHLDVSDACKGAQDWKQCPADVDVASTPVAAYAPGAKDASGNPLSFAGEGDGDPFIARSGNWFPLRKTKFSSTAVDADPLVIKSVAVTYNDATAQVITAAGEGAAGLSAFGPWAALGGGIAGGAFGLLHGFEGFLPEPGLPIATDWRDHLCEPDRKLAQDAKISPPNGRPTLTLPVVVQLEETQYKGDKDPDSCYHLLPVSPTYPAPNGPWEGWLYRVVLGPVIEYPGVSPKDAKAYFDTRGHGDFPVSSCRDAIVQLIWWEAFMSDAKPWISKPMRVADPRFVDPKPLPKAGAINFGPACGATVSYQTYSGSGLSDDVSSFLKEIGSVKKAQDDYFSAKKKAKGG